MFTPIRQVQQVHRPVPGFSLPVCHKPALMLGRGPIMQSIHIATVERQSQASRHGGFGGCA
jgi:hypothetical protein